MKSSQNSTGTSGQAGDFEMMVDIQTIVDSLKIPRKSIYKWCHEHLSTGFPYYKVGRHLRFRLSEVEKWLRKYHRYK